MPVITFILILILLISILVLFKVRKDKKSRINNKELDEIRLMVIKAESKNELERAKERVIKIRNSTLGDQYLVGVCDDLMKSIDIMIETYYHK